MNVESLHFRKERRAFQSKPRSGSCGPADDPEVLGLRILGLHVLVILSIEFCKSGHVDNHPRACCDSSSLALSQLASACRWHRVCLSFLASSAQHSTPTWNYVHCHPSRSTHVLDTSSTRREENRARCSRGM